MSFATSPSSNPALGALAEAAGVAAGEQCSSSSAAAAAVAGEPAAIRVIIPKSLLCRTREHQEPPPWWTLTNSLLPAIFRARSTSGESAAASASLWSVEEQAAIDRIFPLPSCKQKLSQPDHIFSSLFVASPPATPTDAAAAASSAASAAYKGLNVTLLDTIPSTAAAAAAVRSFARGPAIFQPLDLLSNSASRPVQLIVASRGSFVGANTGLYGCDEYVYLREGERLWYLGEPDKLQVFRELFDNNNKLVPESSTFKQGAKKAVAVTKASTVHTAMLLSHGVHAVHQKAGDTIYIPGGWVRAAKNLLDTVSFGSYYLRAWNLKHTIAFAEEEIKHGRLTADSGCVIDLPAIFDSLQQQARDSDLGISPVAAETAVKAWRKCTLPITSSSSADPEQEHPNKKRRATPATL